MAIRFRTRELRSISGWDVIGSVFGRPVEEMSKGRYSKAHQLSRKLLGEFKAEFGSPICGDVQKKLFGRSFDLLKQDDLKAFNEMGGHLDKCTHVCGTAAKGYSTDIGERRSTSQKGYKQKLNALYRKLRCLNFLNNATY